MAVEDDSRTWLPEAPPPRPARRDAAIDAALRKFDGEPASSAHQGKRQPEPWTARRRYQLGAFATAALALIIFVPVALTGVSNDLPTAGSNHVAKTQARPAADTQEPALAPAPSAVKSSRAQAPVEAQHGETKAGSSPGVVATNNRTGGWTEPTTGQKAPPPIQIVESPVIPPVAPPAPAPPAPMTPPPLVRVNTPPPPLATVPQVASEDRAGQQTTAGQIVVTGARIPAKEGKKPLASDDAGNASFLARLQGIIRMNDRGAVARLARLPLRVNAPDGTRIYRDRRSIERDFDIIFTQRVRQAILAQRPNDIFIRDHGAMIGGGELWFDRTCANSACTRRGAARITAVNP